MNEQQFIEPVLHATYTAVYVVEDHGEVYCLMLPRFQDFYFSEWFRTKWLGSRFSPEAIHSISYVETHKRYQQLYRSVRSNND